MISLLFIHWLGDFVLQTRYQAEHKSTSLIQLSNHVCIYSLILFLTGFIFLPTSLTALMLFTGINGLSHFFIDYATSKLNKKLFFLNNKHFFWVSIGFDQFLHAAILFISSPITQN